MFVSIALATYNGAKYLSEQIESILNQSFSNFELIACDDCSSDCTREILGDYAKKDPRIKFFQNNINLGFKKNFEHIISLCQGDYIAFCDQDDIWTNNHLETLLNNIGPHDCIGANAEFIDSRGNLLGITMKKFMPIHVNPTNDIDVFKHEVYGNIIQGSASLVRKSLIEKCSPIPDNVEYHDYWYAMNACLNKGCVYIDNVILKYRRHENNVTTYSKFNIFTAISILNKQIQEKKGIYEKQIHFLNSVKAESYCNEAQLKEIENAITYYKSNPRNPSSIRFFIQNYNKITLSKKRNLAFFIFKLFSFIFLGIK